MNMLEKGRKTLEKLPPWILTAVTTAVILWLTLSPKPLGDVSPMLFPGFDKVAHALMFGFLTMIVLLDRCRYIGWKRLKWGFIIIAVAAVCLLGVMIEFLQKDMELGRSFEVGDIIADSSGSIIFALIWILSDGFRKR